MSRSDVDPAAPLDACRSSGQLGCVKKTPPCGGEERSRFKGQSSVFVSSSKGVLPLSRGPPLLVSGGSKKKINLHSEVKKLLYRIGGVAKIQTTSAAKNHGDYGLYGFSSFCPSTCLKIGQHELT